MEILESQLLDQSQVNMNNSPSAQIYLKAPSQKGTVSLEEAITQRRSLRNFSSESISQSQLSQILWSSQGITDAQGRYRAVPSAGAIYPLEIFIACGENSVEGIDDGVYHYNPTSHSLSLHHKGEIRLELARAALNQEYIYQAPLDIVICALYERTTWGYGSRGERYVHIEVGHIGQNIYLQATALGLATVAIGAFYDEQVRQVLRLDIQYKPLYIMPVGKPSV
ncbi:MAG TPA: SagB/ThcOx family dehydrogenase [Dehalococcoidales bacterium]|nr:SagB/ThcOx family dehydrogenase [Dehalococcoidales bacterium]